MPFEIPESWEWTQIKEISSSILYGVSESAKSKGRYKLLRITDIQDNKVNWDTVPYTDFDDKKATAYILQNNDILFARTGATVGKSYLVQNLSVLSIYASYLIRIQVSKEILSQYIKYYFESGYYWEQISASSLGIGQPNVNGTLLGGLNLPLPPLAEQQRIVAEVEKWFALIDELEANKEDLKEYIKQVKSKVLDLAIHGKLVPQDPNDEPAIELLKRINPNFKPCDTSHYENMPTGWTVSNLLDICKISTGKWDANHAQENGKYRFYTCASKHAYSDTKRFFGECLIVPGNGDIGAVYYFDGDFDAYQRTYVLDNIKIYAQYLYYHFLSNWRQLNDDKKFGSTIKFVRIGNFQDYKVLIPPYEEQKRIVAYLNNLFTIIDSISAEL